MNEIKTKPFEIEKFGLYKSLKDVNNPLYLRKIHFILLQKLEFP